jgi:hypothetical protein
MTVNEYLNSFS